VPSELEHRGPVGSGAMVSSYTILDGLDVPYTNCRRRETFGHFFGHWHVELSRPAQALDVDPFVFV